MTTLSQQIVKLLAHPTTRKAAALLHPGGHLYGRPEHDGDLMAIIGST
jgi:hypothetical protein